MPCGDELPLRWATPFAVILNLVSGKLLAGVGIEICMTVDYTRIDDSPLN